MLRRIELQIIARNNEVKRALIQSHHDATRDTLSIFCVSNAAYHTHLTGYMKSHEPALSVKNTEIPSLKANIYSLPSRGKFNSLEHHCRVSLQTLLNTLELSCSQSKMKRKDHLIQFVARSRKVGVSLGFSIATNRV